MWGPVRLSPRSISQVVCVPTYSLLSQARSAVGQCGDTYVSPRHGIGEVVRVPTYARLAEFDLMAGREGLIG
jgi:hypothetical protein